MSEKRLMMTEEEVRKRTKELLQKTPDDLITSYMFQEQEVKRLNNIIKEAREYIEKEKMYYEDNFTNEDIVKTKLLLEILDKADKGE